mmetsp:Transcript_54160/g.132398  ORF Transcript_54160/g.132398 Transcript_54160/m.132398 type:complete len:219 (-) Transcript_54160:160-816(-)
MGGQALGPKTVWTIREGPSTTAMRASGSASTSRATFLLIRRIPSAACSHAIRETSTDLKLLETWPRRPSLEKPPRWLKKAFVQSAICSGEVHVPMSLAPTARPVTTSRSLRRSSFLAALLNLTPLSLSSSCSSRRLIEGSSARADLDDDPALAFLGGMGSTGCRSPCSAALPFPLSSALPRPSESTSILPGSHPGAGAARRPAPARASRCPSGLLSSF